MKRVSLLSFLLLLFTSAADACTGMYAGKGITTDGSVLIGRTVDFASAEERPWAGAMPAVTATRVAEAVTLTVPAPAEKGFLILKSKTVNALSKSFGLGRVLG